MKLAITLAFALLTLGIYAVLHYYAIRRVLPCVRRGAVRTVVLSFFVLGWALMPAAPLCLWLGWPSVSDALLRLGPLWGVVILYLVLAALVLDVAALACWGAARAGCRMPDSQRLRRWGAWGILLVTAGMVLYGAVNARLPRLREVDLPLPPQARVEALNLVLLSDLHIGSTLDEERLGRVVAMVNALRPDLVLLAGDVVDAEFLPAVLARDAGRPLADLQSRLGVLACPGNHDLHAKNSAGLAYLRDLGIRVLKDEALEVGGVPVAGVNDPAARYLLNEEPRDLEVLLAPWGPEAFAVVMEHTPRPADQLRGPRLYLSGHFHDGQLFPFNWLLRAFVEVPWGLRKAGAAWQFISCGVSGWGPQIKTVGVSEVVLIKLKIKN